MSHFSEIMRVILGLLSVGVLAVSSLVLEIRNKLYRRMVPVRVSSKRRRKA